MRFLKLSLISALILFTTQANAQQAGPYVSGMAGMTILTDSTLEDESGATANFESDVGFGLGLAGGYEFGNGMRAELELSYRRNGADAVDGASVGGSASSLGIMANGYYDFHLGQWVPYLGGGVGLAIIHAKITDGGFTFVDDAGVTMGFQGIAGAGYKLTPNVMPTLDYRLFATLDVTLTDEGGSDFDAEYLTHNIMLGTRYRF